MAATTDYSVTAAGALHIVHNGAPVDTRHKVALDATNPVTAALIARGWISATVAGGLKYPADATLLTTYTVQAAGGGHILHGTANPPAATPLAAGATLALDPQADGTLKLLSRGWIA